MKQLISQQNKQQRDLSAHQKDGNIRSGYEQKNGGP